MPFSNSLEYCRETQNKNGEPVKAPRWGGGVSLSLENEPQIELQLAHAVWRVWRGIGFDRINHAAAAAVDAGVALRRTET
jgi:hypothetical protein